MGATASASMPNAGQPPGSFRANVSPCSPPLAGLSSAPRRFDRPSRPPSTVREAGEPAGGPRRQPRPGISPAQNPRCRDSICIPCGAPRDVQLKPRPAAFQCRARSADHADRQPEPRRQAIGDQPHLLVHPQENTGAVSPFRASPQPGHERLPRPPARARRPVIRAGDHPPYASRQQRPEPYGYAFESATATRCSAAAGAGSRVSNGAAFGNTLAHRRSAGAAGPA
jgi:hypothetical protein